MAEVKDISLNVKRLPKKAIVKHSTPVEVASLSRNMLSLSSVLNSSVYLSPMPKKSFEPEQSFAEQTLQPKAQSSWGLLQKRLSVVSYPTEELRSSSQFTFPRRRLSTIIGSEESAEALSQTEVLPMTSSKRARESVDLHSKSWEGATEQQMPTWQETTTLKETAVKKKRNRKTAPKNVEMRVREWELRQLKNIEEAATHELTIEEL